MSGDNPYATPGTTEEQRQTNDIWRIPSLVALTLLLGVATMSPHLLLITLTMAITNAIAAIVFAISRQRLLVGLASLSCVFWIATLLFTDWGFSSAKPVIRVHWPTFVPAVALLVSWLGWPFWKNAFRRFNNSGG